MGLWAWILLLTWSAALATAVQYTLFRRERRPTDYDWVYVAGGALLGGFTAHVWYGGFGPTFDGLNLLQGALGSVVGAVAAELFYRMYVKRRVTWR